MDVEALAVTEIERMVARCPHLQPHIDKNDKTPFTDGHIDMYSATTKSKQVWRGRVFVQVKGRSVGGKRKSTTSYSVDRSDLLAFQQVGGVLYFYVAIDPKTGNGTPYHSALTPFTIQHYLQKMSEDQKQIAIKVKKFPNLPADIERIVDLALKGTRQQPSLGVDPALFEKMQGFTLFATEELSFDAPLRLVPGETDFALEMRTTSGVSVPVGGTIEFTPQDYVEHKTDLSIGAGPTTYEQVAMRRIDADSAEVKLDNGLSMTVRASAKTQYVVNVTAQSNFSVRKRALEFVVGLADSGRIELNGKLAMLEAMPASNTAPLQEMRAQLTDLRALQELFDVLGVDGSYVNLDELSEQHWRDLAVLHGILVQGASPTNASGKPNRSLVEFGPWAVMIIIVRDNATDAWRCIDPFNPNPPQIFRWSSDGDPAKTIPVTAYDILETEQLCRILNLHLDSIVNAYEVIAEFEDTMGLANQFALQLIGAADACARRRDEFLEGAERLNEWLIRKEGELPIHLVNKCQIRWRSGRLTDDDRDVLRALKHEAARGQIDRALETELSCALLLDDTADAAYLTSKLSDKRRRTMETWPIWRLQPTTALAPADPENDHS